MQILNIADVLDELKPGPVQLKTIVICFALTVIDGFDTQAVAFIAPALREAWGLSPNALGLLFSSGLFGSMLGAMLLGPVGDRVGRRPVILLSTLLFGLMSLVAAQTESLSMLVTARLIGGIGLGGVLPNILALVSEYSPKSIRSTSVVATFIGFPLGAVLGGFSSAHIIPVYGWQMVFVIGGVIPLGLWFIAYLQMPESVHFLLLDETKKSHALKILKRMDPSFTGSEQFTVPARRPKRGSVAGLFKEGHAAWTALLWLLTFCCLLLTYFLIHWIPLVLTDAGFPQGKAIIGVALLNLGGIIGSLIIGRVTDKRGPYLIMMSAIGLSVFLIASVGISADAGIAAVLCLVFLVGITFVGAQLNIAAVAARYYSVANRSAGTGWSIALGRVGSIVGPMVGGIFVAQQLRIEQIFFAAAVPALLAFVAIALMRKYHSGN